MGDYRKMRAMALLLSAALAAAAPVAKEPKWHFKGVTTLTDNHEVPIGWIVNWYAYDDGRCGKDDYMWLEKREIHLPNQQVLVDVACVWEYHGYPGNTPGKVTK